MVFFSLTPQLKGNNKNVTDKQTDRRQISPLDRQTDLTITEHTRRQTSLLDGHIFLHYFFSELSMDTLAFPPSLQSTQTSTQNDRMNI